MINFLDFKEKRVECGCKLTANSIQLLPFNITPYVFYIGDFGDYKYIRSISILDFYGNEVIIKSNLPATLHNGYLTLQNIPFDDYNDVVIKLGLSIYSNLSAGKFVYSIPLKISSYNSCKTTRVSFKCLKTDVMQSISFPFWFWQNKRDVEIENYYQISTKTNISSTTKNAKYKRYQTSMMDIEVLNKLSDVMQLRWVYFDFIRVNQYEPMDIPELQADEGFVECEILVNEYKGIDDEEIKPNYVLGNQSSFYGCFIRFTESVTGMFLKDKRYVIYEKEEVNGIDDEKGVFHSEVSILETYPTISIPFCYVVEENTAISTQNEKLIQIQNG